MVTSAQTVPLPRKTGTRLLPTLAVALSLTAAGCLRQGAVYTRVVKPYSRDFKCTPCGSKTCRVNEHIVREPFSRADVSVSFTSRVVQDAACAAGITNLHYADIETLRVMNGIYERKTLILYGD